MNGVIRLYRAERWLYLHKLTPLAMVIKVAIRCMGGVIPYQADIGKGTFFTERLYCCWYAREAREI